MIKKFDEVKLLCSKLTIRSLTIIGNPVVEEATNGIKKVLSYIVILERKSCIDSHI